MTVSDGGGLKLFFLIPGLSMIISLLSSKSTVLRRKGMRKLSVISISHKPKMLEFVGRKLIEI